MKWLVKLIFTLLIVALAGIVLLLVGLHTRYATELVNRGLTLTGNAHYQIEHIDYHISKPDYVSLTNLQTPRGIIPKLEAWLTPQALWQRQKALQALRLEAPASLDISQSLADWHLERLALSHTPITFNDLQLESASIEVDRWHNGHFSGRFQVSAPQWQYRSLKGTNLLIQGERHQNLWQIEVLTVDTLGGKVSFSGDIDTDKGVYVAQLTLSDLKITTNEIAEQLLKVAQQWQNLPIDIQRIDLINSHIALPNLQVQNINTSLQRWQTRKTWSQQDDATLAFSADVIQYDDWLIDRPLAELRFNQTELSMDIVSARLSGGQVLLRGVLASQALLLDELRLNGLDIHLPTTPTLPTWFEPLDTLSISELHVGQSLLTSLNADFPIQIVGFNGKGQDVVIKADGQWGLWQGQLRLGASRANINHVVTVQPRLTMHSQAGEWTLQELRLPFAAGLLNVSGNMDLSEKGFPWQLNAKSEHAPNHLLHRWLRLPMLISGSHDATLTASGMAQTPLLFRYSLDSEVAMAFYDLAIDTDAMAQQWPDAARQLSEPAPAFTAPPFTLSATRGQIKVPVWKATSAESQFSVGGELDLTAPSNSTLSWQSAFPCHQQRQRWGQPAERSSLCLGNMR